MNLTSQGTLDTTYSGIFAAFGSGLGHNSRGILSLTLLHLALAHSLLHNNNHLCGRKLQIFFSFLTEAINHRLYGARIM